MSEELDDEPGTDAPGRTGALDPGLLALLGPAIDPTRLLSDLAAEAEILRLVAQLWDAPVDLGEPVPPFTPEWGDEP